MADLVGLGVQFAKEITNNENWLFMLSTIEGIAFATLLCRFFIRRGSFGPPSLTQGDLKAFETFLDVYKIRDISVEKSSFETFTDTWCWCRHHTTAEYPVEDWGNDILTGAGQYSFLRPLISELNNAFLSFQYRVWHAKGDFSANYPVMVVAQEWRIWAVSELSHADQPSVYYLESIKKRLKWIEHVRNLGQDDICDLRLTTCWDESNDLSLLNVLRSNIAPKLRSTLDKWQSYEQQQTLQSLLPALQSSLTAMVRNAVEFMQRVVYTKELRVENPSMKDWQPSNILETRLKEFVEEAKVFHVGFPNDFRIKLFEVNGSGDIDDTEAQELRNKFQELSDDVYRASVDSPSRLEEQDIKQLQRQLLERDYGLKEEARHHLCEELVLMLGDTRVIAECVVMIEGLTSFANMGGLLAFAVFSHKEAGDHLKDIFKFTRLTCKHLCWRMKQTSNIVMSGWSNLRRVKTESSWCSSGPVDNVRLALHVNSDMITGTDEVLNYLLQLDVAVEERIRSSEKIQDKINSEVHFYAMLWKHVVRRRGPASLDQT
mmetsp:Transcript_104132/g.184930  ORF Transcript_104132/g.184930 Transcript_104132/m.184930 type:complete len:545 (-) Transcript_104132:122-1756(-)|eukprot:CAMPEP_0197671772 /NCGR_PEP_ID=MMETSP1338-20131121/77408_1 /TAXON_ID=43686 ORGANISM="Pelagodinium beii, Strain RCC1491" /NCGR_SAMPLE_ID=MMETSP1338 /ASSEMBLY_ACC=CAM_ASM_000754 /LENGTH=544 /DNA_ID=CAMNT_0043251743 /DNA_START=100 /DNA_END=1734 /DNA_ORIENTATION=+